MHPKGLGRQKPNYTVYDEPTPVKPQQPFLTIHDRINCYLLTPCAPLSNRKYLPIKHGAVIIHQDYANLICRPLLPTHSSLFALQCSRNSVRYAPEKILASRKCARFLPLKQEQFTTESCNLEKQQLL